MIDLKAAYNLAKQNVESENETEYNLVLARCFEIVDKFVFFFDYDAEIIMEDDSNIKSVDKNTGNVEDFVVIDEKNLMSLINGKEFDVETLEV